MSSAKNIDILSRSPRSASCLLLLKKTVAHQEFERFGKLHGAIHHAMLCRKDDEILRPPPSFFSLLCVILFQVVFCLPFSRNYIPEDL